MEQFGSFLTIVIALAGAFLAAIWVATIFWAFNDARSRTLDIYVRLFATLLVAALGPLGVAIYLILRPPETLDEVYARALGEEALLRELDGPTATATRPGPLLIDYAGQSPQVDPAARVAPGAVLIGRVRLMAGANVWYNAVIRADHEPVTIGENSNVQDGVVIHIDHGTPVVIGNGVTIGHGAIIHGATIEDGALIGMGSTVLDGAVIGERSVVGANALVTQHTVCPPESLLLGVPAKVVGTVQQDQLDYMARNAAEYVSLANTCLGGS